MNNRRTLIATVVGGALILGAAGVGILYFVVFAGSSPQKLALSSPAPSTSASASSSDAAAAAGTWTVGSGSQAGYRVREQLASLAAPSDAVGRTSAVTGTLTLTLTQAASGYTVAAAAFTVDVSKLTSDQARRDQRIHSQGLESDRYPSATFTLTSPIALKADAAGGQTIHTSAGGDLTIHGVTKSVIIPIDARLTGSKIELVGSITFPFSQFGMTPPSIGGFVTVQNNATMEFQLVLTRQGA
jgi:polyisoprenoid-binding protein YceI